MGDRPEQSLLDLLPEVYRQPPGVDFLARESVAYLLNARGWGRLLYLLGKTDYHLVNRVIPPLRQLCNYVVVHATK